MTAPGKATPHRLLVEDDEAGQRLDIFLAEGTGESRSRVQKALKDGYVRVDGQPQERPAYHVREGEVVELDLPAPRPLDLEPADIPLDILAEDAHLVVINKPPGLVVHPAPGHARDTLVNALLGRHTALSGIGGVLRPGIVHRLDRDTSGVLVVAKSDAAHLGLARQLERHTMEREYRALAVQLRGPGLAESGTIETLYGRHPVDRVRFTGRVTEGKQAVTYYRVAARYRDGALAATCRLETGRTHQIRVHLSEAGCPVLGDSLYGSEAVRGTRLIGRQALHAGVLGFAHPVTGQALRFEVPPPEDFRRAETALERGESWR